MAKRIIWSKSAVADRLQILDYWYKRPGHKKYSQKLDQAFRRIIQLLQKFPFMGRALDDREERYFTKEQYQIFYRVTDETLEILRIWDTRRDPDTLDIPE